MIMGNTQGQNEQNRGCSTNGVGAKTPMNSAGAPNAERGKNQQGQSEKGAGCNVKPSGGGCGGCKPNK
jgi:hypothetical protein